MSDSVEFINNKIFETYLSNREDFYEYYEKLFRDECIKYYRKFEGYSYKILKKMEKKLNTYDKKIFRSNIDKHILTNLGICNEEDIKLQSIGNSFESQNDAVSADSIFEDMLHYAIPEYLCNNILDCLEGSYGFKENLLNIIKEGWKDI